MIENMSVVFLFIGLIFLIVLFYGKDKKTKILNLSLGSLLVSFFIGTVSKQNFEINLFILLGLMGVLAYFLKNANILNVCIFSVLLTIIYIFILNFENLYLTSFNFYPILIVGVFLNLLFGKNINEIISNVILSGLVLETINFIYYQNFFNFSGLFNFSFLNFICFYVFTSLMLWIFINFIKKMIIRRKEQCCPLKSHF